MLPNFFLIGPGRCGTSWAAQNLMHHPEIYLPRAKSTRYFVDNYAQPKEWYERFFQGRTEPAIGEASVGYIRSAEAPARIHSLVPDARLIATLRQPIDRAYSSYGRLRALSKPGSATARMSFPQKLQETPELIEHGMHGRNLGRYLEYFSRDNILILFYEDMVADPHQFLVDIFHFLGVDTTFQSPLLYQKLGSTEILNARSKGMYYVYRALIRLGFYRASRYVYGRISQKQAPLDKNLREDLTREYYERDVKQLEAIVGKDLSAWLRV